MGTELAGGRAAQRQDEGLRRRLALIEQVLSDPRNAWMSAMPMSMGFRAPHALLGLKSAVSVRARDFLLDLVREEKWRRMKASGELPVGPLPLNPAGWHFQHGIPTGGALIQQAAVAPKFDLRLMQEPWFGVADTMPTRLLGLTTEASEQLAQSLGGSPRLRGLMPEWRHRTLGEASKAMEEWEKGRSSLEPRDAPLESMTRGNAAYQAMVSQMKRLIEEIKRREKP